MWTLSIDDDSNSDGGQLASWGLTLTTCDGAPPPIVYCTSGTTSNGCSATIGANTQPSAGFAHACVITVTGVETHKNGLIFYGIDNSSFTPIAWARQPELSVHQVAGSAVRAGLRRRSGGRSLRGGVEPGLERVPALGSDVARQPVRRRTRHLRPRLVSRSALAADDQSLERDPADLPALRRTEVRIQSTFSPIRRWRTRVQRNDAVNRGRSSGTVPGSGQIFDPDRGGGAAPPRAMRRPQSGAVPARPSIVTRAADAHLERE